MNKKNLSEADIKVKFISPAVTKPNISQTYLRNFVFAVPPLDEQHAIVTQVENLLGKCALLQTEIENLNTRSKTLLKAFFNETFAVETTTEV